MLVPAHISGWRHPLYETVAIFEPNIRFDGSKETMALNFLFNLTEQTVTVENMGDEPVTLYEKTTSGTSEVMPYTALNAVAKRNANDMINKCMI